MLINILKRLGPEELLKIVKTALDAESFGMPRLDPTVDLLPKPVDVDLPSPTYTTTFHQPPSLQFTTTEVRPSPEIKVDVEPTTETTAYEPDTTVEPGEPLMNPRVQANLAKAIDMIERQTGRPIPEDKRRFLENIALTNPKVLYATARRMIREINHMGH